MLLNGCSAVAGSFVFTPMALPPRPYVTSSRLSAPFLLPGVRNSRGLSRETNLRFSRAPSAIPRHSLSLSASPTPLIRPLLRTTCSIKALAPAKVYKNFKAPIMTEKPEWWLRSLASLPYLIPLHRPFMYAPAVYHLYPFLEKLYDLTYPFLLAASSIPWWFPTVYWYVVSSFLIKERVGPHFYRYHIMMGLLLEVGMTIIEAVFRLVPVTVLCGKLGVHFCAAMTLAYMLVVSECIRSALSGKYPDIPYMSQTAILHTKNS